MLMFALAILTVLGSAQEQTAPWRSVRTDEGRTIEVQPPAVGPYDFPPLAIREGVLRGVTRLRLTVAPDGGLTDCRVVQTAGHAALDAQACRLYRSRARYRPTGGPAASYETSVNWDTER